MSLGKVRINSRKKTKRNRKPPVFGYQATRNYLCLFWHSSLFWWHLQRTFVAFTRICCFYLSEPLPVLLEASGHATSFTKWFWRVRPSFSPGADSIMSCCLSKSGTDYTQTLTFVVVFQIVYAAETIQSASLALLKACESMNNTDCYISSESCRKNQKDI